MKEEFDFLVVGSGLAGLSFALKVANYGKVALLTKTELEQTNTRYAQGGIAAVTYKPDSYKKHIEDTLIAGDALCDLDVVNIVINEAPEQIKKLIEWGTNFDKKNDGKFDLAREGGHSMNRILHHQDNTGFEIQRALSHKVKKHPNIQVFENYFAIDLITQHHLGYNVTRYTRNKECYGAYILDIKRNKIRTFLAKITFIATGGIGNIYQTTTNPPIATGDGIAMAYRAKAHIENLEFVQFHPTALYNPGERPSFLISEAIRGFGGILKTPLGKEFMHKYDKRGSLAPRDIVARAIDTEMKQYGFNHVCIDLRQTNHKDLKIHFPNIYEKCLSIGIDMTKEMIPVIPAAHYLCGGIKVDTNAKTSIERLYAAGESSATGLHGANRLASNSLLEAIVYAERAAKNSILNLDKYKIQAQIPDWNDEGTSHPEEMILITQEFNELQTLMSNYVGIVRSNLRLKRALDRLEILYRETEELYNKTTLSPRLCELRNAINISYLVIKMAKARHESRGLHYTIDYPQKNKII